MPKLTLIEIVVDILNEMDSDVVNSINDTEEANQVARIVKTSYYEIITAKYHKHFDSLHSLDALADVTRPTYLQLPENIVNVHWIRYNDADVAYKAPDKFLADAYLRSSNTFTSTDASGITFKVGNNADPKYWTSFDEEYIVFDSYESAVDNTLQSSKSKCFSYREPAFTLTDTFVPDLPLNMFPQLVAESKSTAFAHIKQMPSEKAEQRASRQRRRVSTQGRVNNGITFPNYGR